MTKDAGVSEYANFKELWLEIHTHLDDDKMALQDLDKITPASIRPRSCQTWQEAMDLLEKEFMINPKLKKMFLKEVEA